MVIGRDLLLRQQFGNAADAVAAMIAGLGPLGEPTNLIARTFYENTRAPRQVVIDWLISRGVSPLTMTQDNDERGSTIGAALVSVNRNTFDFAEPETADAHRALVVIARDRDGYPLDLAAWEPKIDRVTSFFGRAAILGEHELDVARDGALKVRGGFLDWLRHDRTGVVIIDEKRAWRAVLDEEIEAASVEHGLALRKMLRPPGPKVVVPETVVAA